MKKNQLIVLTLCLWSILIHSNANAQCIPTVSNSGTTGDFINNFTFGTLSNLSNGDNPLDYELYPQSAIFTRGNAYSYSIQTGNNLWAQGIGIWIDYNGNNVFTDIGEFVYASSSPVFSTTILTGNITIPASTSLGVKRMRVCSKSSSVVTSSESCGITGFGEYEDYNIAIVSASSCSGPTTAGSAIASTTSPCAGSNVHIILSGASFTGSLTYQWQVSSNCVGPWTNISNVINPSASTPILNIIPSAGSSNAYRCQVICFGSGSSQFSSSTCVTAQPWFCSTPCYGISAATTNSSEEILNVSMGSINNTTTCANPLLGTQGIATGSANKYANFTGAGGVPSTDIYKSSSQNFSLTIGTCSSNFPTSVKIYIDYNHNTNFNDPGEEVYTNNSITSISPATIISGSFVVPSSALTGCTRMRIVNMSTSLGAISPTGLYKWGETEDYSVNIISPPYDASVSSIALPIGNCLSTNETITVNLCNNGSTPINLTADNAIITLSVNGPNGLNSYPLTVNSGTLGALGTNCINVAFPNINLAQGGTYLINANVSIPSLSNANLLNDSLSVPLSKFNSRPNSANHYSICQGNEVPFGQGLSVSGCGGASNLDSMQFNFTVTGPCIDNIGSTDAGDLSGPPSNCSDQYACSFANFLMPNISTGSIYPSYGILTITNLSTNINGVNGFQTTPNEVRMNLFGSSPTGSNLFSPGSAGSTLLGANSNFNYTRTISASQLSLMLSTLSPGNLLNLGYWESFNDSSSISDIEINAGGGTTLATLKIYYQTTPPNYLWYDNPIAGNTISNTQLLDPLSIPNSLINNSNTPGVYTFYAACASDSSCRLPVDFIVNPKPNIQCIASTSCGNFTGQASVNVLDFNYTLNITAPISTQYTMTGANFGPNIVSTALNGDIVYFSNPDTGCVAYPPGSFAGKIALIDRGSCFFETKVFNAQNAGAVGVIIVNNVPDPIFTMGSSNLYNITIPSVMISDIDGAAIKSMLSTSTIVTCSTNTFSFLWNNAETTQSISGLQGGIYSVAVTNNSGCTSTCSSNVITYTPPEITCSPINDCSGSNNSGVDVSINNFSYLLNINSPTPYQFNMTGAVFGPNIVGQPLLGEIVYFSNPDTGCIAYPPGIFAGKIALIDRGSCPFELKTFNAEQAGAVGVIIVNNIPDPIFTMGAANLYPVNIPAIMISQDDGQIIKSLLSAPNIVNCNTPDYNFLWSNGATTQNISGIPNGGYTITVTDPTGCSSACSTNVVNGSTPIVTVNGTSDCNLNNNGSAGITIHSYPYQLYLDAPTAAQANMIGAFFGPAIETYAISGDIIYYSNPDTGCVAYPPGIFTGKIALIDRGSCSFEQKVFNAQNAGATGVIIVNNVPDPIFRMGAVNLYNITIPALMISQTDGQSLKNVLSIFPTATCHTKAYSYEWHHNSNIISNAPSISALSPGNYLVFVADDGCATAATYEVTGPIQAPTITSIGKPNLCADSVVLQASGAGTSLALNGIDQWVDLSTDITNLNDGDFTIEAWIKTTGNNEGVVVSSNNDNIWEPGERALYIDIFGRPAFVGFGNEYIIALSPVNNGAWHHIAVTWDHFYGIGRMYVDGIDQTVFETYYSNSSPNIGTFSIGRPNYVEAPNFFSGEIDEVKIWNIARSQSQIMYGMSNDENPFAAGLLTYYKMNEGNGIITKDQTSGYHGVIINSPTFAPSGAFAYSYLWSTSQFQQEINVYNPGNYGVNITTPLGCSATSNLFEVDQHINPQTIINGPTSFCTGGSVVLSVDSNILQKRFASSVVSYSSQYGSNSWGAIQLLGTPDVFPLYGDIFNSWASTSPDDLREHLELGFLNPAPINYIDIYETFNPGAIDTVYIKNPNTGLFEIVYSNPAGIEPPISKILHIEFPTTSFAVSEIRIAINSAAVPSWNEIDAVAIGNAPSILWSTGATSTSINADSNAIYSYSITYLNACSDTSNLVVINELPCTLAIQLKLFIEGYYIGSNTMTNTLLNQGITINSSITDSIQVLLVNQNFPYNIIDSAITILNTDGSAFATFNSVSDAYYIVIKHRNAIETWSTNPISILPITNYDFTISASQAYGSNQTEVESGIWALYSGDLNQDENIDLLDLGDIETDINNFQFGYFATDINGDGNVDLLDGPIVEENINNFVFSSHP